MKIGVICSSEKHPIWPRLQSWADAHAFQHSIQLAKHLSELCGGDLLFLVSCSEIIQPNQLSIYRFALVLHASDLPNGAGWSPHVWSVIDGSDELTVTLLEASHPVDSGRIWKKLKFPLATDLIWNEINEKLFDAEIELMDFAIENFEKITPVDQIPSGREIRYQRRTPDNSRIDPFQSIAEQFNLLRVCDPNRFPAFFELNGHKYRLILERYDHETI